MIIGFGGLPGSGKTYSMIERALKHRGKRPIYSNMGLTWAEELDKLADLRFVHNALVLLDEGGIWLNSRKRSGLDEEVMAWFAQSRKHGCDLVWTSQRVEGIDAHVRGLTLMYAQCMRIGSIIAHRWFDGASGSPMGRSFTILRKNVYEAYDTYKLVGYADGSGKGDGAAALAQVDRWLHDTLKKAMVRVNELGRVTYRPASEADIFSGEEVIIRTSSGWKALELPSWVHERFSFGMFGQKLVEN